MEYVFHTARKKEESSSQPNLAEPVLHAVVCPGIHCMSWCMITVVVLYVLVYTACPGIHCMITVVVLYVLVYTVCPGIHCMSWYTLHDYSGRVVCPGIHCMSWCMITVVVLYVLVYTA